MLRWQRRAGRSGRDNADAANGVLKRRPASKRLALVLQAIKKLQQSAAEPLVDLVRQGIEIKLQEQLQRLLAMPALWTRGAGARPRNSAEFRRPRRVVPILDDRLPSGPAVFGAPRFKLVNYGLRFHCGTLNASRFSLPTLRLRARRSFRLMAATHK